MISELTSSRTSPSSSNAAQSQSRQSAIATHLGALLGALGQDDYAGAKTHFAKLDQALASQDIVTDGDRAIRASLDKMKAGFAADNPSQIRGGFLDFVAEVRQAAPTQSTSAVASASSATASSPLISNELLTELLAEQAAHPDGAAPGTAHTIASAVARGHGVVLSAEESRRQGFADAAETEALRYQADTPPARADNSVDNVYATVQQGGRTVAVVYRNGTVGGIGGIDLSADSGSSVSSAESRLTSLLRSLTGAQVRYGADAIAAARRTDWLFQG